MRQSRAEEQELDTEPRYFPASSSRPFAPFRYKRRQRLATPLQSLAALTGIVLPVGSLIALLGMGQRGTRTTASGSSSTLSSNWQVVSSPHISPPQKYLWDVSASAANDVWAVGESSDNGSHRKTLIEHWDGVTWRVVANPNPGVAPTLQGVAAVT